MPEHTIFQLLDPGLLDFRYQERLKHLERSRSCFKLWYATKRPLEELGLEESEVWYKHAYCYNESPKESLKDWTLVAESLLDPSAAPAGKGVFSITFPAAYEASEQIAALDEPSYNAYKKQLVTETTRMLEERLFPRLSDDVELVEVATPKTFARYTGNPGGAIFGWKATPSQSGIRRLGTNTPVAGLILREPGLIQEAVAPLCCSQESDAFRKLWLTPKIWLGEKVGAVREPPSSSS